MKVVKAGRTQKGWAKEHKCTGAGNKGGGCGAVLLIEQDDLFQTGRHSYDGSSDYFVTFKCAACGVLTLRGRRLARGPYRSRKLGKSARGTARRPQWAT